MCRRNVVMKHMTILATVHSPNANGKLIQVCVGGQKAKKQNKVGEFDNMTRNRIITIGSSNMDYSQ